ncbi:hypothetical protein D0T51_10955 [Parabacteroides sp. 52]|uniref:tetratricopeptide repeat protein n=1 Tax=Parabacteroides sp. 52 TaxID=2302940 RepID=UPI0013D6EF45|nr:tetratricopeptide repeat protein [Parabacteroides sp. 52]NDV56244.1 hypothetical protein [Parabacteroides sp. 52]
MKIQLFFLCCFTLVGTAQVTTMQDLVNKKQYAEAIAMINQQAATDSTDYATMYTLGQAYEGLLKYREAYDTYKLCLAEDTANIDMLNNLARVAISLGRTSDAQTYFHQVLANDSTHFYAKYQLARLHQQIGNYGEAIKKYEALLIDPDEDYPVIQRHIGDCYNRLEEYDFAAMHYRTAFQSNKENAGLASSLVNTLLRCGEMGISEALEVCDTALCYSPNSLLLKRNRGMSLYMNKMYAEADTLYSKLMAEGDSTLLTIKYAGCSKYYAGQYMHAIEPLEWVYAKDTTAVDVNLLLGSAYGKTYDRKKAYVFFDKAEKGLEPNPFLAKQLLLFRGETLEKDGRREEAFRLYYKAWLDKKDLGETNILSYIVKWYNASHVKDYKDEKKRQEAIFIRCLYVRELLKKKANLPDTYHYHRYFFETLYEDMFFRGVTEEPMLAPDGKKSKLTVEALRELIDKLPEIPEKSRQKIDESRENMLKSQKEYEKRVEEWKKEKEKKALEEKH